MSEMSLTRTDNIFQFLPQQLDEEVFETLVASDSVKIERIISKGQSSPDQGWYDQEQNEWVIVMQGEAVLSFDGGEDVSLTEGGYINIPAHTRHRVKSTSSSPETIWLAVHY